MTLSSRSKLRSIRTLIDYCTISQGVIFVITWGYDDSVTLSVHYRRRRFPEYSKS